MPVNKVIIIGAGFAGPALALQLKEQIPGITCTLYEIRETPTTMGGAINLTCNGLRILDKIGVYKDINGVCAQTPEFELYNAQGAQLGVLRVGRITKEKYGYGTMRVMRTLVHEALLKRLDEEGITIQYGMKLTAVDESQTSVKVTFADGSSDTADLLVGADGIHSVVRSLHVQPSFEPEYSGLSTIYSLIPTVNITSPLYFTSNFAAIFTRRGMFATGFYDAQRSMMYWFNTHEVPAKDRDGWSTHGKEADMIKSQVLERAQEVSIPLVHEIIDASPEIYFYPIYRLPLGGNWYTERTILIGDAGHAMSPHIGQGTSMALEDTAILSRLLQQDGDNLTTVFKRFESIRRPRIKEIFGHSRRSGDMRTIVGLWKQWIREWVMWFGLKVMPESWQTMPFEYDALTVSLDA